MNASTSPQHLVVGEVDQIGSTKEQFHKGKQSYATTLSGQKSAKSNLDLCPVSIEHGVPTVEFTVEEVNVFIREEGLHQAVILKFSYGKPDLQELRRILPIRFNDKSKCNIGQLEYRHILVRFDLFEDFANVVSKTAGHIKFKGDEFFFRTFPWTMDFNPREETSKAVTWISLPELPANFFAKRSLLSIASVAGKLIAIDKETQDRTRPGTARVKILVNLTDRLPKKAKLKIIDKISGKTVEYDQRIVFDNFPKYGSLCNHQGHEIKSCQKNLKELSDQKDRMASPENHVLMGKLKGDAREFVNEKVARSRHEGAYPRQVDVSDLPVQTVADTSKSIAAIECNDHAYPEAVSVQTKNIVVVANEVSTRSSNKKDNNATVISADILDSDQQVIDRASANEKNKKNSSVSPLGNQSYIPSVVINSSDRNDHQVKELKELEKRIRDHQKTELSISDGMDTVQEVTHNVHFAHISKINSDENDPNFLEISADPVNKSCAVDSNVMKDHLREREPTVVPEELCLNFEGVSDVVKRLNNTGSLKSICMADYENSFVNSKYEIGSVSGVKDVPAQQNLKLDYNCNNSDLDSLDETAIKAVQSSGINPIVTDNQSLAKAVIAAENKEELSHSVIKEAKQKDTSSVMIQDENLNQSSIAEMNISDGLIKTTVSLSKKENALNEQARIDVQSKNASDQKDLDSTVVQAQVGSVSGGKAVNANIRGDLDQHRKAVVISDNAIDVESSLLSTEAFDNPAVPNAHCLVTDIGYVCEASHSDDIKQTAGLKLAALSATDHTGTLQKKPTGNSEKNDPTIQKVQSYTPLSISSAYSGEDLNDNEEFSSLEGKNKQLIVANMRDMVIKSKLWDQQHYDDDESLDEESGRWSSDEERHQDGCDCSEEDSNASSKPTVLKKYAEMTGIEKLPNLGSKLNHNAPVFIPTKVSTAEFLKTKSSSPISPQNSMSTENKLVAFQKAAQNQLICSPDHSRFQKEMKGNHIFEEGEEEDIVAHCRKSAARMEDLSPTHSKDIKKIHQRGKSWDDKIVEAPIIRKLPMRNAKQKQTSVLKPTRLRNKREV